MALTPNNRKEEWYKKMADAFSSSGGETILTPISREEEWFKEIADAASGGGGTSDYADLENKPSINGVTLSGNKTTSDLSILPTASWDATVSVGFADLGTTAEISGTSFTKVSTTAFTAAQLDGAIFEMNGQQISIDSSMLTDMTDLGVTGTMINVPNFGNVVFSCTEAGQTVTEVGFYLATAIISYAPLVTMSYTASLTASARAIGAGDMQMQDGVTDLPTGVLYLQYEA